MIFNCFNCSKRIPEGNQKLLSDSLSETLANNSINSNSNSLVNGQQHDDRGTILDIISKVFQVDQKTNPAAFKELKSKQHSTALCEECEVSLEIVYSAKRDFEAMCQPFSFISNFLFKKTKPVKGKSKSKPPSISSQVQAQKSHSKFKSEPGLALAPTSKSKDTTTTTVTLSVNPKSKPKPKAKISSMLVGLDQSNIINTTSRAKPISSILFGLDQSNSSIIDTTSRLSTVSTVNSKPKSKPISSMLFGLDQSNIIDTTSRVSSNNRRNSSNFELSSDPTHNIHKKISNQNQKELPIVSENLKNSKESESEESAYSSAGRFKNSKPKPKPNSKSKQESPPPLPSTQAVNSAPSFKINCNNCSVIFYSLDEASKHNCLQTKTKSEIPTEVADNFPVLQKSKPKSTPKVISSSKAFSKYNPRNECRNRGCTPELKFDTFDKLQTHIKTHVENFLCNYCGSGASRKAYLIKHHMKKKHKGALFSNIIDQSQNPTSSIGQVQVQQKESPAPASPTKTKIVEAVQLFKCKYPNCLKEFENKGTVLNHYKCHFEDRKIKCEVCGHLFLSNYTKEKHKRQVHTRSSQSKGSKRKRTTTTKKKVYVSKNEGGEFLCEYTGCTLSFSTMNSLRAHKGYHSRTLSNNNLVHVQDKDKDPKIIKDTKLSKSEEKTCAFKCQFCPNKYTSFKSKKEHERIKHRFEREFAVRAKLEQEKNNTSTSKPSSVSVSPSKATFNFTTWKCELCSRNFITKSIRDNHMKNSHPGIFKASSSSSSSAHRDSNSNKAKAPAKIISKSQVNVNINGGANSTTTYCKICRTKFSSPANYRRHIRTGLHKSNLAQSRSIIRSMPESRSNSDAEFGKKGYLPIVDLEGEEEDIKKEQKQFRRTTNSIGSLSEITDDFSKIVSNVGLEMGTQKTQDQTQNKCDQCDRVFILKKNLIAHEKTHIYQDRDFICGICNGAFLTHSHLDRHIKQKHSKKNGSASAAQYRCKICVDIFDSQDDLDEHTNEKHSESNRSSNRSSPLDLDEPAAESSTENKKFECNFCETCYPTADKLFEHFRSDLHRDTIARERENDFQD